MVHMSVAAHHLTLKLPGQSMKRKIYLQSPSGPTNDQSTKNHHITCLTHYAAPSGHRLALIAAALSTLAAPAVALAVAKVAEA